MEVSKINVFFFGSPGLGFSSYPSKYVEKVKNFDNSSGNKDLVCTYTIDGEKSIIKFCEYGLTGIGQHGTSRGGRNFGIFIEIFGFKLNEEGVKRVVKYLKDFITNGVLNNPKVNFLEKQGRKMHYSVFSFDDVSVKLDLLITVFKKNFKTDFSNSFTGILGHDKVIYDLVKTESISNTIKSTKPVLPTTPDTTIDTNLKSESTAVDQLNKVDRKKIIVFIFASLFVLTCISTITYLLGKNSQLKQQVTQQALKDVDVPIQNKTPSTTKATQTTENKINPQPTKEQIKAENRFQKLFLDGGSKNALQERNNSIYVNIGSFKHYVRQANYTITNKDDLAKLISNFLFTYTSIDEVFDLTIDEMLTNILNLNPNSWKSFENELLKLKQTTGSDNIYIKPNHNLIPKNLIVLKKQ